MTENRTKSEGFMLRFPDGLRERLKQCADAAGRSMNAEIVVRLDESEPLRITLKHRDQQLARRNEQLSISLKDLRVARRERDNLRVEVINLKKQIADRLETIENLLREGKS